MVTHFRPQDADLYRPYADAVPWDLLAAPGQDPQALADVLELDWIRVAKLDDHTIGAYGLRPVSAIRYELVALAVAPAYRRRGLGRWLLGHAIGLTETKGGREIVVRGQRRRRFLAAVGFEPAGPDLLLTLTPE